MSNESRWDQSRFTSILREYLRITKRTVADAVNTKAFFIARRAVVETPKADALKIGKELSELIYAFKDTKHGAKRTLKTVTRYDALGRTNQVPIAALLVNKRRGERGKPGLYGAAMTEAIRRIRGARQSSVGFIKSGWLPAIRKLEYGVPEKYRRGAAKMDMTIHTSTSPKGSATLASPGARVQAMISNDIGDHGAHQGQHNAALHKYGEPALARAFAVETLGMQQYIDQHMKPDADEFNRNQR